MASVVHPDELESGSTSGVDIRVTFGSHNGSQRLQQSVIRLGPGAGHDASPESDRQAVLYVATGTGTLTVDGASHELEPDAAAYIAPGESVTLSNGGEDDLVVVVVHAPRDRRPAAAERKVVVRAADQPELEASPERTFRYLVDEGAGCFDVTQFLGVVQPSKAPFHSHPYDEVGYIVSGTGVAHIDGEERPLRAGSCFHLAPEEVHCIENVGPGPMRILGVFHPAGSPASRSYQDNK
jgi:mannose-6-phosphate isomerase-like protein (cupin superfamily)